MRWFMASAKLAPGTLFTTESQRVIRLCARRVATTVILRPKPAGPRLTSGTWDYRWLLQYLPGKRSLITIRFDT